MEVSYEFYTPTTLFLAKLLYLFTMNTRAGRCYRGDKSCTPHQESNTDPMVIQLVARHHTVPTEESGFSSPWLPDQLWGFIASHPYIQGVLGGGGAVFHGDEQQGCKVDHSSPSSA
jgi:hypothetical protein